MTVVQLDEKRGIRKPNKIYYKKPADVIQLAPTTKIKKTPTTGRSSAQLVIKGCIDYREEFDWLEHFQSKIIAWENGLLPNTLAIPLYAPQGKEMLADEFLEFLELDEKDVAIVHYEDFPEMIDNMDPHYISRYYAYLGGSSEE